MPLYLDGARLIYGIAAAETDVTLQDIAELCDVFYIGGTKAGALCGEAVVFTGDSMPKHFLTRGGGGGKAARSTACQRKACGSAV